MNASVMMRLGLSLSDGGGSEPEGRVRSAFSCGAVEDGPEMERILEIPRRPIPDNDSDEASELAEFLTARLARSADPYPGALNNVQALCLKEAWETRGLVGQLAVGAGKTLLAYLLPAVLKAKRPLYLCPGSIKGDASTQFAEFKKHWRGPSRMDIVTFEQLSQPGGAQLVDTNGRVVRKTLLERLNPDCLIIDEAHRAKDSGTATSKRIAAFVEARPDVPVCVMTGTPWTSSIKDFEHVLAWALGEENSPLPGTFEEREQWASYLDAKSREGPRVGVGALAQLLPEGAEFLGGEEGRSQIRDALAVRILETPGVIGTQTPPCSIPLRIESWTPAFEDPAISEAFEELNATWCLPDGTEIADPMQLASVRRKLGRGYYNVFDPPPPRSWKTARNEWAKWCREKIKSNRKGIDTEATMASAVRRGVFDDGGLLEAWIEERDEERERTGLREPPSVAVWISDECVNEVAKWVAQHNQLVWTDSIGMGERLERELGIPYYRGKGLDSRGRSILQHPARTAAVASFAANGTGKNLQFQWSKNLWLCAPGEQQLARTHRVGQAASVVENWIYIGCHDHLKAFYAQRDTKARFAEEMLRVGQKLRYADTRMPKTRELVARGGPRWDAPSKRAAD